MLKVKEPIPSEYGFLRDDLTLFTYLHLAASRERTQALLDSGTTSLAYESVQSDRGTLPLLAPMSMATDCACATAGCSSSAASSVAAPFMARPVANRASRRPRPARRR